MIRTVVTVRSINRVLVRNQSHLLKYRYCICVGVFPNGFIKLAQSGFVNAIPLYFRDPTVFETPILVKPNGYDKAVSCEANSFSRDPTVFETQFA